MHIVIAQSRKVDARVWDIKGIAKIWARHLHLHTVSTSPPLTLLQSFRQQALATRYTKPQCRCQLNHSLPLFLCTISRDRGWDSLGYIFLSCNLQPLDRMPHKQCSFLFYCGLAELRRFHQCWHLQVQNYQKDQVLKVFFVPVGARIVFSKRKYKTLPEWDWFALPSLTTYSKEEFFPLQIYEARASWGGWLQSTAKHCLSPSKGLQTRTNDKRALL